MVCAQQKMGPLSRGANTLQATLILYTVVSASSPCIAENNSQQGSIEYTPSPEEQGGVWSVERGDNVHLNPNPRAQARRALLADTRWLGLGRRGRRSSSTTSGKRPPPRWREPPRRAASSRATAPPAVKQVRQGQDDGRPPHKAQSAVDWY